MDSRFSIGGVSLRVDCIGTDFPFLEGPRMRAHAIGRGSADVVWSIVAVPVGDAGASESVSLEDAVAKAVVLGYPRESRGLWMSPLAQAYLRPHRLLLESCAIELRPDAITLFNFATRELVSLLSLEIAESLGERGVSSGQWAPFYPQFSGLLLHSSAVVRRGGAVVFLAPDEGGKTTAARTAPTEAVLSDDQNVVRWECGGFRVHSTPWSLFSGPPRCAPLRAFFRLEKATQFGIARMPATDLVQSVWGEHRSSLLLLPKRRRAAAFDLACAMSRTTPAFTMRLPEGYIDWNAVDRAISAA